MNKKTVQNFSLFLFLLLIATAEVSLPFFGINTGVSLFFAILTLLLGLGFYTSSLPYFLWGVFFGTIYLLVPFGYFALFLYLGYLYFIFLKKYIPFYILEVFFYFILAFLTNYLFFSLTFLVILKALIFYFIFRGLVILLFKK